MRQVPDLELKMPRFFDRYIPGESLWPLQSPRKGSSMTVHLREAVPADYAAILSIDGESQEKLAISFY
jgi:hypothetical protein